MNEELLTRRLQLTDRLFSTLEAIDHLTDASENNLLAYIVDSAQQLINSQIAVIIRYRDKDKLPIHAVWSESSYAYFKQDSDKGFSQPMHAEHLAKWLNLHKPHIENEMKEDLQLPNYHFQIKRFMSVPVSIDESPVLSLLLINKDSDYDDFDLNMMMILLKNVASRLARNEMSLKLRKSERIFRLTYEQAATGMCQTDLEGYIFEVNSKFCEIVGYSRSELMGMRIKDMTYPIDWEIDKHLKHDLISLKIPYFSMEKRYYKKDGSLTWVNTTVSFMKGDHSSEDFLIGVVQDINEQKRAQEILLRHQEALAEEVQQRTQALEGVNRQLQDLNLETTLLYSVQRSTTDTLDVEGLYHNIHVSLRRYLKVSHSFIYALDAEAGDMVMVSGSRKKNPLVNMDQLCRLKQGTAYVDTLINKGRVYEVNAYHDNIHEEKTDDSSDYRVLGNHVDHGHVDPQLECILARGFSKVIMVPLIAQQRTIGMLIMAYRQEAPPISKRHQSLLSMGMQIANAISLALTHSNMEMELSERKRLESIQISILKDLAKERDFVSKVMEVIPIGVVVCDPFGDITYANHTAEKMLRLNMHQPSALKNFTRLNFLDRHGKPLAKYAMPFIAAIQSPLEVFEGLYSRMPEGGGKDLKYYMIKSTAQRDYQNEVQWLVFSIQDVTATMEDEVRMTQLMIASEEANRAKSEFLANMSHEIRTPLNAIIGFSQILNSEMLPPKLASNVQAIQVAGKSLLTLINDILDLSKIESGRLELQPSYVNIEVLCDEVISIFQASVVDKGLNLFRHKTPNPIPPLLLDEQRLRQILLNLIGNAIKFTHEGSVHLEIEAQPSNNHAQAYDIILSVVDTGIGIAPADYQRIFDAFRQQTGQSNRNYEGTGLGLTISRKLSEMMGGTLHLKSEVGKGSTFSLRLFNLRPQTIHQDITANQDFAYGQLKPTFNHNFRFKGQRVLVVDDITLNRQLVEALLTPLNIQVVMVSDGQEALNWLANQLPQGLPELIIMDLRMPNMGGGKKPPTIYDSIPIGSTYPFWP